MVAEGPVYGYLVLCTWTEHHETVEYVAEELLHLTVDMNRKQMAGRGQVHDIPKDSPPVIYFLHLVSIS
jgi:hypothetical protein